MENKNTLKKEIWRYGVKCKGIKNKCRKSDLHFTNSKELGPGVNEPNQIEAENLAKIWLKSNMKTIEIATATATKWLIDENSQCETWEMFNTEHNLEFKINLN